MRVGILGSGRMGSALGAAWCRAGHDVTFSFARDRHRLESVALRAGPRATAGDPKDAAGADVLLIAVPWAGLDTLLAQAGSLRDKAVISCSLPMTADDTDLAVGHGTSGAEVLAERCGARVVSAFNTVPSELIGAVRRAHPNSQLEVVVCGDDPDVKSTAAGLARDAGFSPTDAGPLRMARLIEPFGLLVGHLAYVAGMSPALGYRFVRMEERLDD